jgi:hypothetical protein
MPARVHQAHRRGMPQSRLRTDGRSPLPREQSRLGDDAATLRSIIALGLFALAEHAVWVTVLVVAYRHGGVSETGVASAILLAPAAALAPVAGRAITGPGVSNPLATGYALQTASLTIAASVLALGLDSFAFYAAGAVVMVTTALTRPAHHAFLARRGTTVANATATGIVTGAAQMVGPLLSAAILSVLDALTVFVVAVALLATSTALAMRLPHGCPSAMNTTPALEADPGRTDSPLPGHTLEARRCALMLFGALGLVTVVLGTVETLATEVSYASNATGAAGTGILLAAHGGGMLVGASLAGTMLRRLTETTVMRVGAAVAGASMLTIGVRLGPIWSIAGFALVGIGMQAVVVAGWLLLHRHVCHGNTGAVFGMLESQQLIGNALGAAGAGVATGRFGMWPVLLVAAAALPLSMSTMSPRWLQRLAPGAMRRP